MSGERREITTIVLSMVAVCALGAAALGGLYLVTSRHAAEQRRATEMREVAGLIAVGPGGSWTEVRQSLAPSRGLVFYRIAPVAGAGRPVELAFDLDGARVQAASTAATGAKQGKLVPLGTIYVARRGGATAGFVVEGTTQGYKNRIRFLVGLGPEFEIAGVRVVEHEEDPGLGAEVASPEFDGQFIGRPADAGALTVTRDPMPEDWRSALTELRRMAAGPWLERHRALQARERTRPVYAVTGATISSRALTDGVRVTVERFRARWQRIAPYVSGAARAPVTAAAAQASPLAAAPLGGTR